MNVYTPNIFSPNNDGQNDRFVVRGPEFHSFEIRIFNRWGEEVYQSFDANEGWDGQFRGQNSAPGVYTYYVDGKAVTGEIINRSGNITLVR